MEVELLVLRMELFEHGDDAHDQCGSVHQNGVVLQPQGVLVLLAAD